VIMCGALSGFHALVASGTTPKMLNKESDIRPIGYGAMLLEGFVSITALVQATTSPSTRPRRRSHSRRSTASWSPGWAPNGSGT
jgi:carbon starvation protein CstA